MSDLGVAGAVGVGLVVGVALAPLGPAQGLPWLLGAWALCATGLWGWGGVRALLVGLCLGGASVAVRPLGPELEGPVTVLGTVAGAPSGRSVDVDVLQVWRPGDRWRLDSGRLRVGFDRAPSPGTRVLVHGKARSIEQEPAWPGAPDPVRAARRSRVQTRLWADRWRALGPVTAPADPFAARRHRGLLRALVLGDRTSLPEATITALRGSGTAHLVAISGFHVGLVAGAFTGAARLLLRAVALFWPAGVETGWLWWFGAVGGVLYAQLVGAPASAQRAAGLLLGIAVARSLGREVMPLRLLAVVAGLQVCLDPAAIASAGFQLSYGAMLGLVMVTPRLLRLVPPDLPRVVHWALGSLATTLGATAGTLPAAAWWFQAVAPTSPLANLVAVPWVAMVVMPAGIASALLPDPVGSAFGSVADLAIDGLLAGLAPLVVAPLTPAVGPLGALALLAALVTCGWRLRAGLPLGALVLAAPAHPPSVLVHRDVAVVHSAAGTFVFGDTSPGLLPWLRREGLAAVDVWSGEPDPALARRSREVGTPPIVDALKQRGATARLRGGRVETWRAGRGWRAAGPAP